MLLSQDYFINSGGLCPSCKNPDNEKEDIGEFGLDFAVDMGFQFVECQCGAKYCILRKIINADNVIDLGEDIIYKLNGYSNLCQCNESEKNCLCHLLYDSKIDHYYFNYLQKKPYYQKILKEI